MNASITEKDKLLLLRIWKEAQFPSWRYLLQDLNNEEMHAFNSLEQLEAFIQAQLRAEESTPQC